MCNWLEVFPGLEPLTVKKRKVGLTDRRFISWGQSFGEDFSPDELEAFIRASLLESERMRGAIARARQHLGPSTLVVNVRRGDYYAVPEFFNRYGMNIEGYVRAAAEAATDRHTVSRIRVVSDDVPWCQLNLPSLNHLAPVTFGSETQGPLDDLATLATADSLILANSTFSYWGAHLNNVLRQGGHNHVWAPWFHARHLHEGQAWQLDPRWNVVKDVPGGWSPPYPDTI